jgi:DNA invertase Pin-like site-specific DNA recombinase
MSVCYCYGRHSTNKQSATEEVQRKACEGYWQQTLQPKGYTLGGWYYDAAVSGSKDFSDRIEGAKVWVLAQPGDVIVVSKLDRMSRSLLGGVNTLQLLKAKGVEFVALDIGFDTTTAFGEFGLHLMLALAQMQRRYASERTREVMALKKSKGVPVGRRCVEIPFGWARHGKGKGSYLLPDLEERSRIDQMAGWLGEGMSLQKIATRAGDAPLFWKRSDSKRWSWRTVRDAIRARGYGYPQSFARSRHSPTGVVVPDAVVP